MCLEKVQQPSIPFTPFAILPLSTLSNVGPCYRAICIFIFMLSKVWYTHIMLYMPMYTYETSVRQLAPEIPYPWRQIYMTSITLIEFQTIIWKKCHWLIFWLSHRAFCLPWLWMCTDFWLEKYFSAFMGLLSVSPFEYAQLVWGRHHSASWTR